MDNLNTHTIGALYEVFAPAEARRIAQKLEIHHTPKYSNPSCGLSTDACLSPLNLCDACGGLRLRVQKSGGGA